MVSIGKIICFDKNQFFWKQYNSSNWFRQCNIIAVLFDMQWFFYTLYYLYIGVVSKINDISCSLRRNTMIKNRAGPEADLEEVQYLVGFVSNDCMFSTLNTFYVRQTILHVNISTVYIIYVWHVSMYGNVFLRILHTENMFI